MTRAVTVIVPVYNEVRTVGRVLAALRRLRPRVEVVVVDDGSTDGSGAVLRAHAGPGVRVFTHAANRGKGAAVRTGIARARGRWVVVQDADRETDPRDLPRLLRPLARGGRMAVFGTRFGSHAGTTPVAGRGAAPLPVVAGRGAVRFTRAVNRLITGTVNLLFGARLSDVACAYKAAPTALLRSLPLRARRFEFEAELAARLVQRRVPILEVPVRYTPRSYREGKKIHPLDGLRILWTLLTIRLGA